MPVRDPHTDAVRPVCDTIADTDRRSGSVPSVVVVGRSPFGPPLSCRMSAPCATAWIGAVELARSG